MKHSDRKEIMQSQDYKVIANVLGSIGYRASERGMYEDFYANVYRKFVDTFAAEDPHFNPTAFSYDCAIAMGKQREAVEQRSATV